MGVFSSVSSLLEYAHEHELPLWRAVELADAAEEDLSPEESWEKMRRMLAVMRSALDSYDRSDRSAGGLAGGDGGLMADYISAGKCTAGAVFGKIIAAALSMGECNACMKRIVAAPTAGACGVLPAVLIPVGDELGLSEEKIVESLYVAAGIGEVIAARASISGAECGCQAEIGSASAMAAAALVHLRGGSAEDMANASALALKSLLGLVCDPVAGLVETPCIKRNVIGAVNALSSAEMSLAGVRSRIPPDEVIDAMAEVGAALPPSLRETGEGGLAATPTGLRLSKKR